MFVVDGNCRIEEASSSSEWKEGKNFRLYYSIYVKMILIFINTSFCYFFFQYHLCKTSVLWSVTWSIQRINFLRKFSKIINIKVRNCWNELDLLVYRERCWAENLITKLVVQVNINYLSLWLVHRIVLIPLQIINLLRIEISLGLLRHGIVFEIHIVWNSPQRNKFLCVANYMKRMFWSNLRMCCW